VEFTLKLRPVSMVKSSDDTDRSAATLNTSDQLYSELASLLRDENIDNEVVIDWIDVCTLLSP